MSAEEGLQVAGVGGGGPGWARVRGPGLRHGVGGRPSPELAPPVGPVGHGEAAGFQLLDVHGQQAS